MKTKKEIIRMLEKKLDESPTYVQGEYISLDGIFTYKTGHKPIRIPSECIQLIP